MRSIYNTTGSDNTATVLMRSYNNTTGSVQHRIGRIQPVQISPRADNNIDIGNRGVAGESNTIRIGTAGTQTTTFIAGISGEPLRRVWR